MEILILVITLVGIVLLPFWLIFGKLYIERYFDSQYCEMTSLALYFKKGVIFQTECTVPPDIRNTLQKIEQKTGK
ncbi:MAG: hypothetical protein ACNA8K_04625 [Cyclonatronaceae bacterium]